MTLMWCAGLRAVLQAIDTVVEAARKQQFRQVNDTEGHVITEISRSNRCRPRTCLRLSPAVSLVITRIRDCVSNGPDQYLYRLLHDLVHMAPNVTERPSSRLSHRCIVEG